MNDDIHREEKPAQRNSSSNNGSGSGLEKDRQSLVEAIQIHKVWLAMQENQLRAEERAVDPKYGRRV